MISRQREGGPEVLVTLGLRNCSVRVSSQFNVKRQFHSLNRISAFVALDEAAGRNVDCPQVDGNVIDIHDPGRVCHTTLDCLNVFRIKDTGDCES